MTAHRNTGRELELKLAVCEGAMDTVLHDAGIQPLSTRPPRHEVTTYFETPDRALAQRGMSLRVRCADGHCVQTLKADRHGDVAADRAEWEWAIDRERPDLSLLRQTGIGNDWPSERALKPVLVTDIDRSTRILEPEDGTVVEAVLDEGTIIAGDAREPVRELELELRSGDPVALYRLALALHASAPVTIVHESKAERGYRLRDGSVAGACKAKPVAVTPKMSAAATFARIVATGLGHLLMNRPAALAGNAEGVHQMRIAIRRLRAALTLFKPCLEVHATARFEDELRRMGRIFGEARDWDVFSLQILPEALATKGVAAWRNFLEQPTAVQREAAHRGAEQEIRAPLFTSLVLGLAAWAEQGRIGGETLGDAALAMPIEDLCPRLLDRLARKVERRGRHIGHHSDMQRHALRKSLKKLRYGIDYVAAIYPPKTAKSYRRACKRLQQVLGDINDTVAATGLADRLTEGSRPDLAPAAGALATQLERQRTEALRRLPKRWQAFDAQPHFWA